MFLPLIPFYKTFFKTPTYAGRENCDSFYFTKILLWYLVLFLICYVWSVVRLVITSESFTKIFPVVHETFC